MGEWRENFFTGRGARVRLDDRLKLEKLIHIVRGNYKKGLLHGVGGGSVCKYGMTKSESDEWWNKGKVVRSLNRWLLNTEGTVLVRALDAACSQRAGSK